MHSRFQDMTGMVFGSLTVIRFAGRKSKASHWLCSCVCGSEREIARSNLRRGVKSCGCLTSGAIAAAQTKHGEARSNRRTSEYTIWAGMKSRCSNPKTPAYTYYGSRGIKVCERWKKFENFLADMGRHPEGMSLDRINNDGDYEPGNCRWATDQQQTQNQRTNRYLEFNGERLILVEWARRFGIDKCLLIRRIRKFGQQRAMELGSHKFYKKRAKNRD